MVEELLHYFCCFKDNRSFAIVRVKGCSKHVSSVVAAEVTLGVARGLLQERPLQFQRGNVPVKSWPTVVSWSTSSQPDFVGAFGRRKTVRNRKARFCTQSCSKAGQLLVNSSRTPHGVRASLWRIPFPTCGVYPFACFPNEMVYDIAFFAPKNLLRLFLPSKWL